VRRYVLAWFAEAPALTTTIATLATTIATLATNFATLPNHQP
jgi:hypothetical protein